MEREMVQQKIYELLNEFGEDLANEHTEVCNVIAGMINDAPADISANMLVADILQKMDVSYISIIITMVQYATEDTVLIASNPDLEIYNYLSNYLITLDEIDETAVSHTPVYLH